MLRRDVTGALVRKQEHRMDKVGAVVLFKAKPGEGMEVALRVAAALPAVEKEPGTRPWVVLHSDADSDTVFLVDLFDTEAHRAAHLTGEAAKLIFSTVPPLLAEEPAIHLCTITALKDA
jgi:quinol monooxygenase YgiN